MHPATASLRLANKHLKPHLFRRLQSTMATAYKIHVAPENTGLWHIQQNETVAKKATDLLQEDLETHHVFFNHDGFHNHISHHLLALYGTGAAAVDLERGYMENKNYQRPVVKLHEHLADELRDWENAKKRLGKEQYYADFLIFFQREIDRLGWQETLKEHVFKGDERSEDMLARLFSGFLHPLIQLMYGVEWEQPAIVAMGLAQAAVHQNSLQEFLYAAEEAASTTATPMPSVASLLEAIQRDVKMAGAAQPKDANKIRGLLSRARDEAVKYAAQVRVAPEELEERTAEMFNAVVYQAAAAAIHPGKEPKFDFFLMHHINAAPIFPALNSQDWLPREAKARLLEWKIRMDLIEYAARSCPPLGVDKIAAYAPKDDTKHPGPTADALLPRMHGFVDDGHACKLFRAVEVGRRASEPYEKSGGEDRFPIRGDLWSKVAHLVVDSVEAGGPTWVRGAGLDEAWQGVPDRKQVSQQGKAEQNERL